MRRDPMESVARTMRSGRSPSLHRWTVNSYPMRSFRQETATPSVTASRCSCDADQTMRAVLENATCGPAIRSGPGSKGASMVCFISKSGFARPVRTGYDRQIAQIHLGAITKRRESIEDSRRLHARRRQSASRRAVAIMMPHATSVRPVAWSIRRRSEGEPERAATCAAHRASIPGTRMGAAEQR